MTDTIRIRRKGRIEVAGGKPAVVGGDGPCRPDLCALGAVPHAHCVCGLPMALGAALCDLCRAEGLVLDEVLTDDHEVEWDGRRRPSRRRRWPVGVPIARYEDLLQTVLNPADRGRPRTSTREAA